MQSDDFSEVTDSRAPTTPPAKVKGRKAQAFFINPPSMPLAEKKKYKAMAETSLTSEVEVPVDEVIGEYADSKHRYYFARYKGGIAHKIRARPFTAQYGDLVAEYERKKEAGELAPFDPSAHYVHPKSRIRTVINISGNRATVRIGSEPQKTREVSIETVLDSDDDNGDLYGSDQRDYEASNNEESGDEDDEDGTSSDSIPVRRATRLRTKPAHLPFSPKKTRSRKVFIVVSSDDEEAQSEAAAPTRRSTRTRKGAKANLDEDAFESVEDSEDSYKASTSRRKSDVKRPAKPRKKGSRPAYGHFRDIADLDYDSYDEDSVPLRAHRDVCEKCHRKPAHELVKAERRKPKGKASRKKKDEFEESGDEIERLTALGGWVRCLKCPVTAHWKCLASTQRDEILKAAREKDRSDWRSAHPQDQSADDGDKSKLNKDEPGKRQGLEISQTTEFICGACMKGGICMGCNEVALVAETNPPSETSIQATKSAVLSADKDDDIEMIDGTQESNHISPRELLFRCFTCKRVAHYEHLPRPPHTTSELDAVDLAIYYQQEIRWLCGDCSSYTYSLDVILAWRPYPTNAVEPPGAPNGLPNYKSHLPREYLVKWLDRSYRRIQWVPHMWLVSTSPAKLKNFLAGGTKIELLSEAVANDMMNADDQELPSFEIGGGESRDSSTKPGQKLPTAVSDALPDAERRIPPAWKTVDRILDVLLWYPAKRRKNGKKSDLIDDNEFKAAFDHGEQPSADLTETVDEYEARTRKQINMKCDKLVVWAFIKWGDLGYDHATWDAPPRPEEPGYAAFQTAFQRFIHSRTVTVPRLSRNEIRILDERSPDEYRKNHLLKDGEQPKLGQDSQLKLMPFQVDGFNWLCNNWWTRQHCILADEMGLGKTVQIVTFIGNIVDKFKAYPALVVVPNSTITNWVREFERWAPNLRVVPFYGEAKARDIIKRYELNHDSKSAGTTGAKFHVLVTTYETLTNPKDFTPVFKNQPRWEVLVVDEGQRLKSDSSLLFKKLNELNSIHRIIMTGTPLNNNMRELFNLMNFLDPKEWHDLEALEKDYAELDEELVKQLHKRLKPYFLRRIKSEVLQLPPKNEVIVPVSMAPLQKEIYRSILSHNLDILNGLTRPSITAGAQTKAKINNVLMQLRKCLQHPYLYDEDIEPRGLPMQETHDKLIDGSAKLRFLKALLPKLKSRGHRVLLFSQFVIALNVIEDFLVGEGLKYLRLDGSTKQVDRQKGMDEFNRPGSDVFIYLLTTRAGGVGINLWSADTVIIFDPDFNPHQDLQAIARAYRYGQQKTCLVFKLMVKDSAEERIVQVGKKKLILDHLIVQKMDDDDSAGENVQSILTYGAKALFEDTEGSRDIIYTDHDIEKLIEKTEKEGDQQVAPKEGGLSFEFAKIWAADKDTMEEVVDEEPDDQGDSWAQTLERLNLEREKVKAQEVTGRGVRRKATAAPNTKVYIDGTPVKPSKKGKEKSKSTISDSAYSGDSVGHISDNISDSDATSNFGVEDVGFEPGVKRKKKKGLLSPIDNFPTSDTEELCGLCGKMHGDHLGDCPMTEKSEFLAEYRAMLLLHADDEPIQQRSIAIKAIDEVLRRRGHINLIVGQPLHLVEPPTKAAVKKPPKLPKVQAAASEQAGPSKRPGPSKQPQAGSSKRGLPDIETGWSGPPPKVKLSKHGEGSSKAAPSSKYSSSAKEGKTETARLVSDLANEAQTLVIAGPSKRPSSPLPSNVMSQKKKAKSSAFGPSCPVCGNTPSHLIKDCPLVKLGPHSIAKEIKRLDQNPAMAGVVEVLRKILIKQKKKEAQTLTQAAQVPSSDVLEVSD